MSFRPVVTRLSSCDICSGVRKNIYRGFLSSISAMVYVFMFSTKPVILIPWCKKPRNRGKQGQLFPLLLCISPGMCPWYRIITFIAYYRKESTSLPVHRNSGCSLNPRCPKISRQWKSRASDNM
ncbi:hypothetical protein C8R41DRAFT_827829, partial [Lentinula lateritia]